MIEEECSGNGALACLQAGYDADAALIPEPFGPTILTHQVGVLWFKVTVRGAARHVLSASSGVNAIEICFPIIAALRSLEAELNDGPRPEAYKRFDHPLNLNIGLFKRRQLAVLGSGRSRISRPAVLFSRSSIR